MRIFLLGYPGNLGGANTEALHTIKLWRANHLDVHLIPTWGTDPAIESQLEALGCTTHHVKEAALESVPGLEGSVVVGMCNQHFCHQGSRLRALGCKLVWVNCMTFLFGHERQFCETHGMFDALVFQSAFQRGELEPELKRYGYDPSQGYLIHGALDLDSLAYDPKPHLPGEPFVFGRISRPDIDKWSSNTWPIYSRVNYPNKQALMLGADQRTLDKIGGSPEWAECLPPQSISAADYYARLHCLFPINGGARENWPRAGLEAMAAGVPIVAQRKWGWAEMIEDKETGYLGDSDEELAHWVSMLAWDETERLWIARNALDRLRDEIADPEVIWSGWEQLMHDVIEGRVAA